ncbi:hypothetical protein I6B53_03410 [Schaalia sp. 19OD2882]|uniref:hypothetical protein n=1 Tax=Schaalia sp. 19OD2882 TaxID=2794089 RepID=UPI001C1EA15C|nr:hypothetical protein [Schaalia sp. 19OD2882]QWW20159.1 hypothetical protein I6B53_03410 [Schaalia sp. 19OD2882]
MDDARDNPRGDEAVCRTNSENGQIRSDALELVPSTTLVEVTPGVAVVFGEVPDGLELISIDMLPSFDRAQLSAALGSLGNAGTIVGNIAEAVSSAQGLFRVNDATLSLLKSGGQMATKEGAKLGTIFKNGKLVAQARFVPASMTAATAIAAIGPAVAMIALQMQLGEISGLVRSNIQLTTQTLKAIRNEQWAELEGLSESVDEAVKETRELDAITDSVWEPIAASAPSIRKQQKLYRKNVAGHIDELGKVEGSARRHYVESNAEAIVFDTYALLSSLKTYAEYQAVRAALARKRSVGDESEAQLFDRITRNTPDEIDESLTEIRLLTDSLVRELRIIAELSGPATVPLTKKRKDAKASQFTCRQLLEAIEPLAKVLRPVAETPVVPKIVCAPEGIDLDRYLRILRWFLADGETLRGVAFPFERTPSSDRVQLLLLTKLDRAWNRVASGRGDKFGEKRPPKIFVAVTDRRIITARPTDFLERGELEQIYSLNDVRYVRVRANREGNLRRTVDVFTEQQDIHWTFPDAASESDIDSLAAVLSEAGCHATPVPAVVEQSSPGVLA